MKKAVLFILCLFAFMPAVQLSAGYHVEKIGDFPIVGSVKHKGFILDDGHIYRPLNAEQKKVTLDWQLGDTILVLQGESRNRFILVNTRTGQKIWARIVGW